MVLLKVFRTLPQRYAGLGGTTNERLSKQDQVFVLPKPFRSINKEGREMNSITDEVKAEAKGFKVWEVENVVDFKSSI